MDLCKLAYAHDLITAQQILDNNITAANSLYRWKPTDPTRDVKKEYFALPLNIAILVQNTDMIDLLLQYEADPTLRDSMGRYNYKIKLKKCISVCYIHPRKERF